jgi:hypothetical protein
MVHIDNITKRTRKRYQLRKMVSVPLFVGVFWALLTTSAYAASLSFSPASPTFPNQCTSCIDIILNTAGATTNASDVIITYDTSRLEIIDALPSVSGTQVSPGSAYEALFYNDVNTTTGVIKLTAGSATSIFNGSGTIATILLKNKTGVSSASLAYTFSGAGVTTDSNIADYVTSSDLLTSVSNASITFSGTYCPPTTDTTNLVL